MARAAVAGTDRNRCCSGKGMEIGLVMSLDARTSPQCRSMGTVRPLRMCPRDRRRISVVSGRERRHRLISGNEATFRMNTDNIMRSD